MVKVVHIVLGKANPDRLNGVNKVVHSLATQAILTGRDVAVWGFTPQPDNSFASFPLRQFAHKPYDFCLMDDVKDAIEQAPRDTVFHLHGGLTPLFYGLARFLKRHDRPYCVTLHGCLLPQSLWHGFWYKYPYIWLFERFILNHAIAVHGITARERRAITRLAPKAHMVVIPNGAALQTYHPATPDTTHGIRFLYMGRFAMAHKGLDKLIKAFAIFRETYQHGYLFLAGAGDDQADLKALITQHHLKHHVRILPPQFHADKTHLMESADIFIHTSRWDVMPTGCLEAAAYGKPLLVTHATGLGHYVDKHQAGWVAKTTAPFEIAQHMSDAYQAWRSGDTLNLGRNAHRMIETELNWTLLLERYYTDLYGHVTA